MSTKPASFIGRLYTVSDDQERSVITLCTELSLWWKCKAYAGTVVGSLDPKMVGSSAERERGRASGTTNDSSELTGRD